MSSLRIADRDIARVFLIDDDESVRNSYGFAVEDMNLTPVQVSEPIVDLDSLIASIDNVTDGVICDYHLNNSRYSRVNGDEIVKELYIKKYPSLLCSRAQDAAFSVRRLRRYIPSIVSANDLTPESIYYSFKACISEFNGQFSQHRKPYRTLIRVENKEDFYVGCMKISAVIPGWDSRTVIDVVLKQEDTVLFDEIRKTLEGGDFFRAFCTVNLGSEDSDEIYICDWEAL